MSILPVVRIHTCTSLPPPLSSPAWPRAVIASPPPLPAARAVQLLRVPSLGPTHLQPAPKTGEATCSLFLAIAYPHELLQWHGCEAEGPSGGGRRGGGCVRAAAHAPLAELDDDVRLAPEEHFRVGGGARGDLHSSRGEGKDEAQAACSGSLPILSLPPLPQDDPEHAEVTQRSAAAPSLASTLAGRADTALACSSSSRNRQGGRGVHGLAG